MQITSKGQVTIPQEVRNRLGLLPHTKVEFELAGDHARIRKARRQPGEDTRGRLVLEVLRGSADTRMSTDEILALTRSGPRRAKRRRA
jgi:AbrB family looped-hinge helix DNA binding protein